MLKRLLTVAACSFLLTSVLANAQSVDAYTTSCQSYLKRMGEMSIDNVVTMVELKPAAQNQPMLVGDEDYYNMVIPPALVDEIRQTNAPAWMAFHFMPTREVLAGFVGSPSYTSTSGLVSNIVIAFPDKCIISDDFPRDIATIPSMLLMNIHLNQKLIQPDGSYKMMTPELVQEIMKKTDAQKIQSIRIFLNKPLTENAFTYLEQLGMLPKQ